MILVRLLLLAFVVIGAVSPPVASAKSNAPPTDLSSEGIEDDSLCTCSLADTDWAPRPLEHVLPAPANTPGFAPIGAPFTEELVRLPFRPPMAR